MAKYREYRYLHGQRQGGQVNDGQTQGAQGTCVDRGRVGRRRLTLARHREHSYLCGGGGRPGVGAGS